MSRRTVTWRASSRYCFSSGRSGTEDRNENVPENPFWTLLPITSFLPGGQVHSQHPEHFAVKNSWHLQCACRFHQFMFCLRINQSPVGLFHSSTFPQPVHGRLLSGPTARSDVETLEHLRFQIVCDGVPLQSPLVTPEPSASDGANPTPAKIPSSQLRTDDLSGFSHHHHLLLLLLFTHCQRL